MSTNEEFDELARRKLEERAFPYQEADWQAARKLIDAGRRKRRTWPWFTGGALLLIGGSLWFLHSGTPAATERALAEHAAPLPLPAAHQPFPISTPSAPRQADAAPATPARAATPSAVDEPAGTAPAGTKHQEPAAATADAHPSPQDQSRAAATTAQHRKPHTAPRDQSRWAVTASRVEPSSQQSSASSAEDRPQQEAPATATHQSEMALAERDAETHPVASPQEHSSRTGNQPKEENRAQRPAEKQDPGSGVNVPLPELETPHAPAAAAPANPEQQPTAAAPQEQRTTGATHAGVAGTSPADSTAQAGASAPVADSLATAPAPDVPPLVPQRAPWEVGILGGAYQTRSHYAGGNSHAWSDAVHGERSLAFGAEIMHVGRNFGIGTGLYYGSYAERLRAPAVDRSTTSFHDHWSLAPVDTTVLVITDTLPGDPPTYAGSPQDTSFLVLVNHPDTVVSSTRLREAKEQVNRVSYLEIPLLLDAHVVQGRWSLGLRGGPTLGLLTGRRGAVPNADEDGYLSFSDQQFRELVLGYTARAYVRYRFNAAWSAGLEPGMRGLFGNSLATGELVQRPAAFGMMLSLTYRLR